MGLLVTVSAGQSWLNRKNTGNAGREEQWCQMVRMLMHMALHG